MKKRFRAFRISVLLAATLLIAGNVLAYLQARAMLTFVTAGERTKEPEKLAGVDKLKVLFTGVRLPKPLKTSTPAAHGLPFEAVVIGSSKEVVLGAWVCKAQSPDICVLMFHGYSAEKSSLLKEAELFYGFGAEIILVDFRGSGESSGISTTVGYDEADDVAATFEYAKSKYPNAKMILYGESMGAAAVLRAISKNGIEPEGVVIVSVFDQLLQTVKNRFGAMGIPSFPCAHLLTFWAGVHVGANAFEHNPVDYAKSVRCPALFMHGENDSRAKLKEGRKVFGAVPGDKKQFSEFKNQGHAAHVASHEVEWKIAIQWLLNEVQRNSGEQSNTAYPKPANEI